VGQGLVFGWFWSWGISDRRLVRQKLGKNTHPNHGGCHCPMAAKVPSPWHRRIEQLANMLRDKYVIKTRESYCFYYAFISYFKARHIIDRRCLSVYGLCNAESIILSAGGAETLILSACGAESMMLSAFPDIMIVSAPPAASMIPSVPFDCVITLLSR
jgi:hypothetical protein